MNPPTTPSPETSFFAFMRPASAARLALSVVLALSLAGCGPSLEDVAANLKSEDARTRKRAVEYIAKLGRKDLTPMIEPMLKDPDPDVREEAASALGDADIRNPTSLPALAEALLDPSIRGKALQAMERIKEPGSWRLVEPHLEHPDPEVRKFAEKAIRGIIEHLSPYDNFYSYPEPVHHRMGELIFSQCELYPPAPGVIRPEGIEK